jgi:predicted esterase
MRAPQGQDASLPTDYARAHALFRSKFEDRARLAGMDAVLRCTGSALRNDRRTRAVAALILGSSVASARAATQPTSAPDAPLPRGAVIERVACAGAPEQSYALYLPSAYAPDRAWPILYAFDPGAQGARPVRLAVDAAERFGWIVAGSNNSRNGPTAEIQAAVAALLEDTQGRFPIDPRRVYATGLSGGARVAAGLALGCHGCVAGVFAQAAGLPVGSSGAAVDFAWFASAGRRDMNYGELFELEQELARRGARQRLRVFDGGHEWAPAPVWSEAIEWLELVAMNEGRRPRDSALSRQLFDQAAARAAAFRQQGSLVDEQRELAAVVRDFGGGEDVAAARARLAELAASTAWRKAISRERDLLAEQAKLTAELQLDLARLAEPPGDDRGALVLQANRDAANLARGKAGAKEEGRRVVYDRALTQAFIAAMEAGRGALRQRHGESALALFEVAATLRPESPGPQLARAQGLAEAGRRQDAVRALRRATELGSSAADLERALAQNESLAKLRDDKDVRTLLAAPPRP